ncbi:hypothetical protein [Parvularcula sp. LCG005]|uniref:hypothetical protein n=1 Tax=Parvularcula sp. LCG005 TaxID=3078805 RepID=UPI0029436A9D|nr:hypothetical protein [Parvularcula sp. LCG005]WOI54596.1 hypothetical protein RUI03_06255 [Parvularcula sp. LCG005]
MSFEGKYSVTIDTPMGRQEGTLDLAQAGDELTGTMAAMGDSSSIKNGKADGDTASWEVDITKPMPMTLTFNGTKSGDAINGTVTLGAFGQSTFSATAA